MKRLVSLIVFFLSASCVIAGGPIWGVNYWVDYVPQERGGHSYYQLKFHLLSLEGAGDHIYIQFRHDWRSVSSDGTLGDWSTAINTRSLSSPDGEISWTSEGVMKGVRFYGGTTEDENAWYNEDGEIEAYFEGDTDPAPPPPDDYGTVIIYTVYVWDSGTGDYVAQFSMDGSGPAKEQIEAILGIDISRGSIASIDPETGLLRRSYYDQDSNRVAIGLEGGVSGDAYIDRVNSPYGGGAYWVPAIGDAPGHFSDTPPPSSHALDSPDDAGFWDTLDQATPTHEFWLQGDGSTSTLVYFDTPGGREYYRVDQHTDGTYSVHAPTGDQWQPSASGPGSVWTGSALDQHTITAIDDDVSTWSSVDGAVQTGSYAPVAGHVTETDRTSSLSGASTGTVDYVSMAGAVASGVHQSRDDISSAIKQGLESSSIAKNLETLAGLETDDTEFDFDAQERPEYDITMASDYGISGVGTSVSNAYMQADFDAGVGFFSAVGSRFFSWSDPFVMLGRQSQVSINLGDYAVGSILGMPESIDIDLTEWPVATFRMLELIALGALTIFATIHILRDMW